jgi:hypothetical protein
MAMRFQNFMIDGADYIDWSKNEDELKSGLGGNATLG